MVAIVGVEHEAILQAVREMYGDVAAHPERGFHFPTGRTACEYVGYPQHELDSLPVGVVDAFAGVEYPFIAGDLRRGDCIVDIGCGSGVDALIAAARVGSGGRVWALDVTPGMLARLGAHAGENARRIALVHAHAHAIPLPSASVDVVTSNGVLNLVPDKVAAVREIYRVLRPGGRIQIADVVLGKPVSESCRADPRLWVECIVGAMLEEVYVDVFRTVGFAGVEVVRRRDYFAASPSRETRELAAALNGESLVLRGVKPA